MDIKVWGPWARKRKSLFSFGFDIGPGVVVIGLLFWIVLIRAREETPQQTGGSFEPTESDIDSAMEAWDGDITRDDARRFVIDMREKLRHEQGNATHNNGRRRQ